MSRERCPDCGSRSGYARYPNGTYCFRCNRRTTALVPLKQLLEGKQLTTNEKCVLPDDLTAAFPVVALKWLRQYGITDKEIQQNEIRWSPSKQSLVFPIFGEDDSESVVAYEMRCFEPGSKTVWKGVPKSEVLHIHGMALLPKAETLVIVEDNISAMKVGRHYPTLCLFGSSIPDNLLQRLWRFLKDERPGVDLTLWLDNDKLSTALKTGQKASGMGFTCRVMNTTEDPKCYPNHHIKEMVMEQLASNKGVYHGK